MIVIIVVAIVFFIVIFSQHLFSDVSGYVNERQNACAHIRVDGSVKNRTIELGFVNNVDNAAFPSVFATNGAKMMARMAIKNDSSVGVRSRISLNFDFDAMIDFNTAYVNPYGWIGREEFRPHIREDGGVAFSVEVPPHETLNMYVPFSLSENSLREMYRYVWSISYVDSECERYSKKMAGEFVILNENTYDRLSDRLPKVLDVAGGRYCTPNNKGIDARGAYMLINTPYLGEHSASIGGVVFFSDILTKNNPSRIVLDIPDDLLPAAGVYIIEITGGGRTYKFDLPYRGAC